MDSRFVFTLIICSSSLNCASCARNCVLSLGFSGFWFLICVTSSFKNVCLLTVESRTLGVAGGGAGAGLGLDANGLTMVAIDRKSTRLNSSHLVISYAVFCLK